MESRYVEKFKHDLGHILPVGLGAQRSIGEEDGVILRSDTKLAEGVKPDPFHAIPVGYNTALNGVVEAPDLGFVALSEVGKQMLPSGHRYILDVFVLSSNPCHDAGVSIARTTNNRPDVM